MFKNVQKCINVLRKHLKLVKQYSWAQCEVKNNIFNNSNNKKKKAGGEKGENHSKVIHPFSQQSFPPQLSFCTKPLWHLYAI